MQPSRLAFEWLVGLGGPMDSDVEAAVQRLIDKDEIIDLVHRWIAATVLRLGVPVVSNDTIFRDVPGLVLEAVSSS